MPFELSTLAIVPAGINVTVKGIQTTYELQSVPAETQALFKLIDATKSDILKAREKRLVLAKTCELEDLTEWDRSVCDTEAALLDLEKLLEPARLDLRHNNGKLRVKTRCLWVLRDSKSLSATSDRLLLAHQRMLSAQLMTRIECDQVRREQGRPPPPYATSKTIIKKAADELGKGDDARKALANSLRIVRNDDTIVRPPSPVYTVAESTMSARKRAFDALFERHEHTRALSQMNPTRMFDPITEVQSTGLVHPAQTPARRESVPASVRALRKPVPSTSLPNLIQTSALRRNGTRSQPRTAVKPPAPSRSPSPVLPPSPPRSPSPFQSEAGDSPREIIELPAIPITPKRLSPISSPIPQPERQHQELAKIVNFRDRIQAQIIDKSSPPQPRYRQRPPYPTTNPTTPEPTYATPHTFTISSRRPRTPPPTSNYVPSHNFLTQRPSPTSPNSDPGPPMFDRTSGAGAPRSYTATTSSSLAYSYSQTPEPMLSCRPPSPRASGSRPAGPSARPARSHPPLSYRPPANEFAAAISQFPGTATGAPRSTISSVTSLIGSSDLTGISALNLRTVTASPPAVTPNGSNSTAYGLKSVPHVFAGHRKPITIMWKPEIEVVRDDESEHGKQRGEIVYPYSPSTVGVNQIESVRDGIGDSEGKNGIAQTDWVYTPYRPT